MRVSSNNTDSFYRNSSFLSLEKDTALIIQRLLDDTELKKLLYYNTKDCLSKPALSQEETYSLIGKQIKIVPKAEINSEGYPYIIVGFDGFVPNSNNPQFRDNYITFDIFCPFDKWDLGDFQLRPYKIAGRLDARLNNQKLTGIGVLNFVGGNNIPVNDELAGFSLTYAAIHGKDDEIE